MQAENKTTTHNRTVRFFGLDPVAGRESEVYSMQVKLSYDGPTNCLNGIAMDHNLIPRMIVAVNTNEPAYNALKVLTETPWILAFLEANDPKALEQARKVIADMEIHEDRICRGPNEPHHKAMGETYNGKAAG